MTQLRIDADFFAYRAAQQSETEIEWGDHLTTVQSDKRNAIAILEREIKALRKLYRADEEDVVLYFTWPTNFRKQIDPEYKGKRTKRKPCGYSTLLDYCRGRYEVHELPDLEADDVLGLECHGNYGDIVLVSPDKDFRQINCSQYDPLSNEERFPSLEEADYFFYQQVLTGDPVDGYKGLPGVGAVKAKAILDKAKGSLWDAVVDAYKERGYAEADALQQARLARILRPGEYDFRTQTTNLWTPS